MNSTRHESAPASARHGFARSAAMQDAIRALAPAVAGSGGVLLCGEAGSGRELFARALHEATAAPGTSLEEFLRRSMYQVPNGRPFLTVDCADREALEQRLFGRPAASDGAADDLERITEACALHLAGGGTLVLRHIHEMPPRLQRRLARVLRDGEAWLHPRGGNASIVQLALRPIGTAERDDSEALVPELLRRLAQTIVTVPPLRARREDIPGLVRCIVSDLCPNGTAGRKTVSRQAIALLAALPWRGNLAELESLLRTLVHRVAARQIRLADVLAHVRLDGPVATSIYTGTLKEARERFEREYVAAVLTQHRGRMAEAARTLGLQRTNLYRKVRQLSVRRGAFGRDLS